MQPTSTQAADRWEVATTGDDAIAILLNDHVAIKDQLNLLNSSPPPLRAQMLGRLALLLTVHNATEEHFIYPAIRLLALRPGEAEALYHETAHTDIIVFMLSNLDPNEHAFVTNAIDLRDAILEHVRREEEIEFPQLRESSAQELQKITDDVRRFRQMFKPSGPLPGTQAPG